MTARTNQFGYEFENKLASIRMFGVEQRPSSIKINDVNIFSFEYNSETKVLIFDFLHPNSNQTIISILLIEK